MTQTPPGPRDKVRLRRSPVFTKRPQIYDIEDGELAVNFNAREPGLFIRDLDDEGNKRIRKIGPVHFGDIAPNSEAGLYGFNASLSNGEMWVDSSQGESLYFLKIWNQEANDGQGAWIVVGEAYGLLDGYLDQFKDGEDGDDYIHTDRTRLKINNKTALRGLSTASGNRLIINENNEFANGVEVNASTLDISSNGVNLVSQTMSPFQTDSVNAGVFTYVAHGLFNGEKVYVYPELADEETPSSLTSGDYIVINATNDTFQLSEDGITPVPPTGNIYLAPYETIEISANADYFSTGNFAYKDLRLTPADGQIEDGHWDVYHNPTNGNVRIYARAGNALIEPETPGLSIEVKNASLTQAIPAGTPIHVIGYDGITKLAKVSPSKTSEPPSMPSIGVTKKAIEAGGRGYVVFLGKIDGLNTSVLPGSFGGDGADEGRVLYVGENGGLTLDPPSLAIGKGNQAIAILISQNSTSGSIVVNNPATFTGLPPLPEEYVWVGNSASVATAHRLNSDSFQVRTVSQDVVELALASNVKFGGYEFLYDGNLRSRAQSKVSTATIDISIYDPVVVATFNSSEYRSAKFLIQISCLDPNNDYEVSEILIVHNGTNAYLTQYGTVNTRDAAERFGEFDAQITNENQCELLFRKHPWILNDVVIRSLRTALLV
jgi:hypothetical protein